MILDSGIAGFLASTHRGAANDNKNLLRRPRVRPIHQMLTAYPHGLTLVPSAQRPDEFD